MSSSPVMRSQSKTWRTRVFVATSSAVIWKSFSSSVILKILYHVHRNLKSECFIEDRIDRPLHNFSFQNLHKRNATRFKWICWYFVYLKLWQEKDFDKGIALPHKIHPWQVLGNPADRGQRQVDLILTLHSTTVKMNVPASYIAWKLERISHYLNISPFLIIVNISS